MFKVGDKVRVKKSVMTPTRGWGKINHKSVGTIYVDFPEQNGWACVPNEIELINQPNPHFMSTLTDRVKALVKTEPEKSLYEAGFTDVNDNLTEEGQAILDNIIFEENKEKLAEIAKKIIEEDKASKK